MNYTPYHIHTMHSNGTTNIDSVTSYKDYIDKAAELGMTAFAFSEHGNIFEWLHKKEYTESKGLKYIHAVEAYLTFTLEEKIRDNYHCILIAKDYEGFKEINSLTSKAYNRLDNHFYYVPRISFEELSNTSEHIIVTTACLAGVLNGGNALNKEKFIGFLSNNRDRCFLEIQHHNCEEQANYNKTLYELSKVINVPLIAGTDSHAIDKRHLKGRSLMQKAKDVEFANEDELDMAFHTYDELVEAYKNQNAIPMDAVLEALENTNRMANMVEEFSIDRSNKYPKLYGDKSEEVFKQKINEGYKSRGIYKLPNAQEYLDRVHYEFDTYKHNGAINFMLLEEDYKKAMRSEGVKYGYSRGSVSGSLIAYLLYITEMDSIKYHLNFERFMNKERISLADVDTDWYSSDREKVKEYLYHKEGLYCCDIITFNTIALKGAIDDVCRGLYKKGDDDKSYLNIAKEIKSLAEADEAKAREKYKEVFEYVDIVNGVIISIGNHPAGCVVSPFPVDEWFGTCTTSTNQYPISTLNMKEIDSLNFVKLDILGLDNVGLIYKTCELAGIPYITPGDIDSEDVNVWRSIRDNTTLIFQWESDFASSLLKDLFSNETISKIKKRNPNFSYIDLFSMGNGAIRPAGESYRVALSHGEYHDNGCKELNDFLKPTLGYLVYQCQIIEFLHNFCGYTMGEADVVRRCLDEHSLITMSNGAQKEIKDIKEGDEVVVLNDNGSFGFSNVGKVYDNGVQDTYEIKTLNQYVLRGTSQHKVLTQRGWVKIGELTTEDYLMTPKSIKFKSNTSLRPNQRLSKSDMFLIGMLIGDGTIGSFPMAFTNSDVELIEKFKECVNKRTRNKKECEFYIDSIPGKSVESVYTIKIKSKNYRESTQSLIKRLGLHCYSADKHIPINLMEYPMDEKLLSLLGGLFSTDGGAISQSRSIAYYTISKRLADDVKSLLLKSGIYSYVCSKKVKGYDYDSYNVIINQRDSLLKFKTTILPYVVGKKQNEMMRVIERNENTTSYNYLMPNDIVREIKSSARDYNITLDKTVKFNSVTDVKARHIIGELCCPQTYKMLMSDYMPVKINSIKEVGQSHVYDLEINNVHNYIANGLVVHNCFSKKLGTEKHIPRIEKGFCDTMLAKYNMPIEKSSKIVKDFLQVIEDASDYLFSKNHSDPYSWIGYVCGYLRYYYPLEFLTTALNIWQNDQEKSSEIIDYAKSIGINIQSIAFGHSDSEYAFDKETKTIYKGIASIKYLNGQIAKELLTLKDNHYDNFVDILNDTKDMSINARQMKILIGLGFFKEFGDTNKLLKVYDIYSTLQKSITPDGLKKLGLNFEDCRPFVTKATQKSAFIDACSLLKNIRVEYEPRTINEDVKAQCEYLGYVDIKDEKYDKMLVILDVKESNYTTKCKVYSLKTGKTLEVRIQNKIYKGCKLKVGDIIKVLGQEIKPKSERDADGNWVASKTEKVVYLTKYVRL